MIGSQFLGHSCHMTEWIFTAMLWRIIMYVIRGATSWWWRHHPSIKKTVEKLSSRCYFSPSGWIYPVIRSGGSTGPSPVHTPPSRTKFFFNFMQFCGKLRKIICWYQVSLEGWCLHLRRITDLPLIKNLLCSHFTLVGRVKPVSHLTFLLTRMHSSRMCTVCCLPNRGCYCNPLQWSRSNIASLRRKQKLSEFYQIS